MLLAQTRDAAQAAIDAIHGQLTLPKTSEPLVVRWADAPGAKRRVGRDRRPRCSSIEGLRDEVPQQERGLAYSEESSEPAFPFLTLVSSAGVRILHKHAAISTRS